MRRSALYQSAAFVLLAILVGCSESTTTAAGLNLLKRVPSEWIREFKELTPSDENQWGEFGAGGWRERTQKRPNGTLYAQNSLRSCALTLPIVELRDRLIEIDMWTVFKRSAAREPTRVTVRLNGGHVLGEFELVGSPKTYDFVAATELWILGDNQLSFDFEGGAPNSSSKGMSLAVGRVAYGVDRLPRFESNQERLHLTSKTGVRFNLELSGQCEVVLAGQSSGAGNVELSASGVDPRTGTLLARQLLGSQIVDQGEFELNLPLTRSGNEVVQLELLWSGESDESELVVSELSLREERRLARPPVIFISIDTLSARNMSLYGYPRKTTPNIEAFARDAIVFENARANAPYTVQSYMSQFTGLYPAAHKLSVGTDEASSPYVLHDQIASNRWTMAEMLQAAGYATAAWIDNPWLVRKMGWQQGFDHYDTSAAKAPNQIQNPTGGLHHVAELAETWISGLDSNSPFFAFLQILDPHGPYLPSSHFDRGFATDEHYEQRMLPTGNNQLHAFGVVPDYVARSLVPDGDLPDEIDAGQLIAAYDAKIAETDERLGRFFSYLREIGIYDQALIILSADHGESLVAHDYYFDHGTMYDEVLGIPLVIRLPKGARGGTRRTDNVQLVDLLPTIADVVELPQRTYYHGESLLNESAPNSRMVFSESGIMKQASLVHGVWKLIRFEPLDSALSTQLSHPRVDRDWLRETFPWYTAALRTNQETLDYFSANPAVEAAVNDGLVRQLAGPFDELYRLSDDPLELNDLSDSHSAELAKMRELMDGELARAEEARMAAIPGIIPVSLELEDVQQLGDLGYFGDPDETSQDK